MESKISKNQNKMYIVKAFFYSYTLAIKGRKEGAKKAGEVTAMADWNGCF